MERKIRVGVVFGGKSTEHAVSLLSAQSIIRTLDPERFEMVFIGIDKEGRWALCDNARPLLHADDPEQIALCPSAHPVAVVPGGSEQRLSVLTDSHRATPIDVVFPVLHGPLGEDGTVQGMLKLANLPFVGAGVLGSAVGMDKDVAKRLLRDAGIPVANFLAVNARHAVTLTYDEVVTRLGSPFFIKPANAGSSVGVSKVTNTEDYATALREALKFDTKVLIEEFIEGREIECAVLGNDEPTASCLGEIIPTHDFYSYEAKYLDEHGALLKIPAEIEQGTGEHLRRLAVQTFQTLCCEGMARVDFFLRPNGKAIVNEINTIPGFTSISMYPKLWEASGLPYGKLVERLIDLALERHEREQRLQTSI
ncbi:MAG TPA: D-alanine--D-alanine ligase [Candidatus Hydrogenedentes bacterium]|nr:D-alanine--D-alanine ligase [Candidatus Hydrogenedentota bacterium]